MVKKFTLYLSLIAFGYAIFKSHSFLVLSFGIALFIYAMTTLETSFKLMGGSNFPKMIKTFTKTNAKSFFFGLTSTAIMQSSGLVSVLAMSFLSAGMITLSSGLGIILGANLGTTTGAWIISIFGLKMDIAKYAMPMVIFGVFLTLDKKNSIKGVGYLLFSLGLLFLGIDYMKSAFTSATAIDLSQYAIPGLKGILVYAVIGIIATVLMQSSHATLTLTLTALATGQIAYDNAIAIAIGSNVGSTIMAVIGSLRTNYQGKQLMVAHVFFNAFTALIIIAVFNPFLELVDTLSNSLGIGADDYTLKLSLFHTCFNLLMAIAFYPFIDKLTSRLSRLFMREKTPEPYIYFSETALEYPESSLEVLTKELRRLFKITSKMISKAINVEYKYVKDRTISDEEILKNSRDEIKMNFDKQYDNKFKPLYSAIIEYSIKAGNKSDEKHSEAFMDTRHACLLLAEALKNARNFHSNFKEFSNSQNPYLKKEYDNLRIHIINALRNTADISSNTEGIDSEFFIKEELYFKNLSITYGNTYTKGEISPSDLTSLMNDAVLCGSLIECFAEIGELICKYMNYLDKSKESNKKEEEV
ncbi:MAG: Na/Pi cotransporter family protein [Campylobacteraceae bacterium]|nr:Na/Pi cotransporter family protein [Campylobacteraceae bacterium]